MTWKSRRRKAFLRYVESLKKTPIYLIDDYILIYEFGIDFRKNNYFNIKRNIQVEYEQLVKTKKIKSYFDFDNCFNPDLTLDIPFERDKKKADFLSKKYLLSIGKEWNQRLIALYPKHEYTLVLYYNTEDTEWYLDFYNGFINMENFKNCENTIKIN